MSTLHTYPSTIDLDVLNFTRLSPTKSSYPNSYPKGSLTKKCGLKISAVSCDSITTTDSSSKDSSSSNLESPRNVMDFRGSLSSLDNQDEVPSIFNSGSKSNNKRKSTVDETKYKTEMCKKWESMGSCPYGKKCKFAHGREELNNRPNQKKYKSKNCNSFHTSMICPYGSRCQFAHENRTLDELFARPEANLLDAFVAKEGLDVKNRRLPCFRKFAQH